MAIKVGKYELVRKLATVGWRCSSPGSSGRGLEKTVVVKRLLYHLAEDPRSEPTPSHKRGRAPRNRGNTPSQRQMGHAFC